MKYLCVFVSLFSVSLFAAPPLNFERDVLPSLEKSCFKCHSYKTKKPKAKLRVDRAEDMLKFEGFIVPGKPEKSSLFTLVDLPQGHDDIMPPTDKAPAFGEKEKAKLKLWIEQGAHFGDWKEFTPDENKKVSSGLSSQKVKVDMDTASSEIDKLVAQNLIKNKMKANPAADDASYLRRIYLAIVGRIPTVQETRSFLNSQNPDKRKILVETLQNSEGYVSNMFNYWANILRVQSNQEGNIQGAWIQYLKKSLRENTPYDKWVKEMVTAEGATWQNPAIGFLRRDSRNRLAGYEALTGVFLGKQIGCAQCHDHPYDTTTRRDYFEMYGYYASAHPYFPQERTLNKLNGRAINKEISELHSSMRLKKAKYGKDTRDIWLTGYLTIKKLGQRITSQTNSRMSKLPKDYQYDDGKPGKHLEPDVLFGEIRPLKKDEKPMLVFGEWLTSPENLKFTYVIVNRLWHRTMGASLLGQLSNIKEVKNSLNPELVDYLAKLMVSLDYDTKAFERIIFNSKIYQRMATKEDTATKQKAFTGPVLRRMTAEQLWDSAMTLVKVDLDANLGPKTPDFSFYNDVMNAASREEFWSIVIAHAKETRPSKNRHKMNMMVRKLAESGVDPSQFKRASEIKQPAPAGHFLKQFGQADRETVEDQWINPTIPQSLTLLNGKLFDFIKKDTSTVSIAMAKETTPEKKIETIYEAILSKRPSQGDVQKTLASIKEGNQYDYSALMWALLNTKQFLFIK